MDFALTVEHDLIREMAHKFGQQQVLPGLAERDRAHASDRGVLDAMGRAGILGLSLPEAFGGAGADYISLGIVSEELERADSSARVVISVHCALHSLTLLQWGTDEQRRRWLPDLATGHAIGAFALTEPNAGSDAINIRTRARKEGDEYVLDGEKTWISLGDFADQVLVFAVTDPDARPKSKRLSAFVVSRNTPGFSSRPIKGKLGVRAGDTAQIFLDRVRVPATDRLGAEGDGFKIAMSALDNGRYTVAAGAVGLIQACLDACVPYAKERRVGGAPLANQQLVQQMIAKMAAGRDVGRLLYCQVGWMKNAGLRHTRECSLAKWRNCDAALEAASDAVEVLGAYGYSDEFPVERYLRNARGAVIYEGTREIHTLIQAEYELGQRVDRALGRPLPRWPFEE